MTRKLVSAAALGAVVSLGACTDPATLDPTLSNNTTQGALFGGILGAGIGAVTGGNAGQVALASAAGAVAGGLLGNHLDKQEAELRSQLANDGITITNTGDKLIVSLPQDITFDTASYAVRPSLQSDLGKVAENLQRYPDSSVQIIGHTDNEGDATYNLGLSHQRATAVSDVIQGRGVAGSRLQTFGRGEEDPLASNLTPEGRAQNRRVDIVVIPNKA